MQNLSFTQSRFLITNDDLQKNHTFDVCIVTRTSIRKDSCCHHEPGKNIDLSNSKCSKNTCAVYVHSSGTTGAPKTVMLGHYALNQWTADFNELFSSPVEEQVCLSVAPFYHCMGLLAEVHRPLSSGATIVMLDRWETKRAIALIKQYAVSVLTGAPKLYNNLLASSEFVGEEIRQLKQCYVGGDTIPRSIIDAFDKRIGHGRHLFATYGLSETGCVTSALSPSNDKADASGYPIGNARFLVLQDDGKLAVEGEGELLISAKTLMLGYFHDDETTRGVFIENEGQVYVKTGDFGRIDRD